MATPESRGGGGQLCLAPPPVRTAFTAPRSAPRAAARWNGSSAAAPAKSAAAAAAVSSQRTAVATPSGSGALAGARCKVDGCPGVLDASGRCPCCVKRAAWLEQNIPKRHCEICGGTLTRKRALKFCDACKPVALRVNVHLAKQPRGVKKK
jgi:hypothetical protein